MMLIVLVFAHIAQMKGVFLACLLQRVHWIILFSSIFCGRLYYPVYDQHGHEVTDDNITSSLLLALHRMTQY